LLNAKVSRVDEIVLRESQKGCHTPVAVDTKDGEAHAAIGSAGATRDAGAAGKIRVDDIDPANSEK
jgi:hypothetical protein